jgi:hypothetical protein
MRGLSSRLAVFGFAACLFLMWSCSDNPATGGNPFVGTWDMTQRTVDYVNGQLHLVVTVPATDTTFQEELVIDTFTYVRTSIVHGIADSVTVDSGSYTVSGDTIKSVPVFGSIIGDTTYIKYSFTGTGISFTQRLDSLRTRITDYARR